KTMKSLRLYWRHLPAALAVTLTLAACGGGAPPPDEGAANQAPAVAEAQSAANGSDTTVNVVAKNMSFTLDRTEVRPGTITFVVTNQDHMPHDFRIEGNGQEWKTALLDPGESESLTVTLVSGTYNYICTVPGHGIIMKG